MGCALNKTEDIELQWHWTADGKLIPVISGGDGEDDDGEEEENNSDGGDEGEGDSGGDGDGDDNPRIKELSDEAARYRVRAKNHRNRADKAETALKAVATKLGIKAEDLLEGDIDKLELGAGDESEKIIAMTKDMQALLDTNQELEQALANKTIDDEIRDMASSMGFRGDRIKRVLKNVDRADIELDDEDGKVSGVREALEALKKEVPEWLDQPGGQEDEDDEEESGGTGSKTASTSRRFNGSKSGKNQLDKEALLKKYPALGNR